MNDDIIDEAMRYQAITSLRNDYLLKAFGKWAEILKYPSQEYMFTKTMLNVYLMEDIDGSMNEKNYMIRNETEKYLKSYFRAKGLPLAYFDATKLSIGSFNANDPKQCCEALVFVKYFERAFNSNDTLEAIIDFLKTQGEAVDKIDPKLKSEVEQEFRGFLQAKGFPTSYMDAKQGLVA